MFEMQTGDEAVLRAGIGALTSGGMGSSICRCTQVMQGARVWVPRAG